MQLIDRARKLRKSEEISIKALSDKTGISINTLHSLECKRTKPHLETFEKYLNGIGYKLYIKEIEKWKSKLRTN